jgi:dTDP-4-dehydrorhamnose reductase
MKILITGVNGFLGYYFINELLNHGHNVVATNRGESKLTFNSPNFTYATMDFTNEHTVAAIFKQHAPNYIIHAGAISKPDECEKNKMVADTINVDGTSILLSVAKKYAAGFLFLSTDFVFDGQTGMYTETDVVNPVNYYGVTKVAAENLVMQYEYVWAIVRTVLVYGKAHTKQNNMLSIVCQKLTQGESYAVFNDQVRTPTYAGDLAKAIVTIIEKNARGVYNICGDEILTPYDMAIATAEFLNLDKSLIKKAATNDFVQVAQRPLKTGLNITKAKTELGYQPINFKEGLKQTLG